MSTEHLAGIGIGFRVDSQEANRTLVMNFASSLFNYGCCFVKNDEFVRECVTDFFIELGNDAGKTDTAADVKVYLFKKFRQYLLEVQPNDNHGPYAFSLGLEPQIKLSSLEMEFLYLRICEQLTKNMIMEIVPAHPNSRPLFSLARLITKNKLLGLIPMNFSYRRNHKFNVQSH